MTYDEFSTIAKVINAAYPGKEAMFTSAKQVEVWHSMLHDLDYEIAKKAVMNLIANSEYKPSIASIRKEYAALTTVPHLAEAEAWDMVRDGIRNGIYGASEEFEKFPEAVKKAVGSPASLSEWAVLPSSEVETVVQSLFKKAYRTEVERMSQDAVLGQIGTRKGELAQIAESLAKKLEMK